MVREHAAKLLYTPTLWGSDVTRMTIDAVLLQVPTSTSMIDQRGAVEAAIMADGFGLFEAAARYVAACVGDSGQLRPGIIGSAMVAAFGDETAVNVTRARAHAEIAHLVNGLHTGIYTESLCRACIKYIAACIAEHGPGPEQNDP